MDVPGQRRAAAGRGAGFACRQGPFNIAVFNSPPRGLRRRSVAIRWSSWLHRGPKRSLWFISLSLCAIAPETSAVIRLALAPKSLKSQPPQTSADVVRRPLAARPISLPATLRAIRLGQVLPPAARNSSRPIVEVATPQQQANPPQGSPRGRCSAKITPRFLTVKVACIVYPSQTSYCPTALGVAP